MSKHTPGPWWIAEHGVRDVGGYIAHTNSVQRYEGQDERYALEVARREADKRLIAAAPDLLEALQAALSVCERSATGTAGEVAAILTPALAKALPLNAKVSGAGTASTALAGCASTEENK